MISAKEVREIFADVIVYILSNVALKIDSLMKGDFSYHFVYNSHRLL